MSNQTGRFIVVEGADGVGKSTVLKLLLPKLMEAGPYGGVRFFHWKPVRSGIHDGGIPETVPHDPRGTAPRNSLASLVYLGYHWLSFWSGLMAVTASRSSALAGRAGSIPNWVLMYMSLYPGEPSRSGL